MRNRLRNLDNETSIKITLTAIASGAIWFYTGPVASVAAREVFTRTYDFLYGIPIWYNPSYSLTYAPIREHISNYAYKFGGAMLGSICAPFIYKGINVASNMGGKLLTKLGIVAEPKLPEPIQDIPPLQFSKVKDKKQFFLNESGKLDGDKREKRLSRGFNDIESRKEKRLSREGGGMPDSRKEKRMSQERYGIDPQKEKRLSKDINQLTRSDRRKSQEFSQLVSSAPVRLLK